MIKFAAAEILTNQFVLMFVTALTGLLIGKVRIGRFRLGISGALFTGIFFGWYIRHSIFSVYDADEMPAFAQAALDRGIVDEIFFYLFLIIFIAAVGLLASKDIDAVIRKYGLKFAALGIVITFTGALVCYLSMFILRNADPYAIAGIYTGALTSSPGLGAALESVEHIGPFAQEAVAAGHAVAYPFGVIIVIFAVHLLPQIFKIDVTKEIDKLEREDIGTNSIENNNGRTSKEASFDLPAFTAVCLIGYLIGQIQINLGPLGFIGLGSTGGILIISLFLGHIGKVGPLNFRMDNKVLTALRQFAIVFFLSIVGLKYGYAAVDTLVSGGIFLVLASLLSGGIAVLAGFLMGFYIFKINWILLAGAICGGMTSTPGLGVAIDITRSDHVASGYGASYPVALLFMVLFTILLHTLPIPS